MKKILFIASMLLLGFSITFISCDKSNTDSLSSDPQSQQLQKDQAITDRILRFQDRVIKTKLNPEYKSDETQSVDEVIWDIEASLNYTYGFVNEPTNLTRAKESTLEFELSATDQMTEQESVQLYDDILARVRDLYDEIDNDEKYIKSIDVELKSSPNKSTENEIGVNVMLGTKVSEEETPYTDWIYGGFEGGTCEFDPNTLGDNAATELTRVISQTYPNYEEGDETEDGCRIYFTDQTTFSVHPQDRPNPDDDVADNVEDYLLFYATSELTSTGDIEEAECILEEQMEFYDDNIRLMIQEIPHNYDRVLFSVDDYQVEENGETVIYHKLRESIGIKHIDTQSCNYPIDIHDDI